MMNSGLIQSKSELLSGGIAQLVERLPCTQEVSGSSPLTSTLTNTDQPQKKEKSAPRLTFLKKKSECWSLEL